MAAIPDEAKHLFEGKNFAHVATINKDGSPQVSPVWVRIEGDLIVFNTTEGLLKTKNIRRNPSVAVSITAPPEENPLEHLVVQGKVVEMTHEGADDDMDAQTKRYIGLDTFPLRQPGEERVMVKIQPEKALHRGHNMLITDGTIKIV